MDPSQQEHRGRQNRAPTAAQLQAFADKQSIVAGQKRGANEVSDLETPEGSRPMLGLDRTRHRPNHPKHDLQQQRSSDPGSSPSLSAINATESPVSHQHVEPSSVPLLSSSPEVASEPPSDVMDSTEPEPAAEAAISPSSSNSRPLDSEISSPSPIASLSSLDRRSPAVQAMLREAFNEGQREGRRENKVKLDEAEAKVEEIRTKASEDQLAFEKICKEKDKGLHDQQMAMARYQKELMARRSRIQFLEQQASLGSPQPPSQQHGQNITGQQITDAEKRFSAQWRELEATRAQNERIRGDLANWQVQWGRITTDLEKWKAAFSAKAEQLDSCQRQLGHSNGELQESIAKANELAAAKSGETGSLKAATEELESKLSVLSFDFNSLDRLYTTLVQVAAERSAETDSVNALNEELESTSQQVEDGKDVINALTSKNNKLTKLREQLEEKVGRQAEEIEGLSAKNEELKKELKEREEEDARAPRNRQPSPDQAIDQTTGGIDDLPTNLAQETAAAELELVREGLERERRAIEAESLRRENRATAALDGMEERERSRRQLLIDELEDKDARLYDAQMQIRELNERLLAATPPQPSPTPPSAPPSLPAPPPPPPPPETSPTIPNLPAAQPQRPSRPARILATAARTNFSPRRILIMLAIFLLAFLLPFLRSFSRPASEDIDSRQIPIEVLPEVEVVSRGADYEDRGRQWRAWAMGNWERNERIAGGEVAGEAYRLYDGWDY